MNELMLPKDIDYNESRYEIEKAAGIRTRGGLAKVKLTPTVVRVVRMHADGRTVDEISRAIRRSKSYIYRILHDEKAKAMLKASTNLLQGEFSQLRGKANDAVRTGLSSPDSKVRLQAARLFFEQQGDLESAAHRRSHETAEDVIARMLNLQLNVNFGGPGVGPSLDRAIRDNRVDSGSSSSPLTEALRHREANEVSGVPSHASED